MLVHWIWLSTRKNLKEREIVAVLQYFGDPESIYYAPAEAYRQVPGMSLKGDRSLQDKSLEEAQEILRRCSQEGIHLLTLQDAAYPARLKGIADPPVVLYYKGVLPNMDAVPLIGAVGTRSFSDHGMQMARKIGYQLAQGGAVVVSGMAEGIDAGLISGALAAGGAVIGILGCGADRVYPASNRKLYENALQCGCLISEFPPGTQPFKWNFPKRNRLISGISNGVLVVEAPERSGALITARQAAEQGRDLFAVPGNPNSPSCQGSNQLLEDGAVKVCTGWDILEHYQHRYTCIVPSADDCPEPAELEKLTLEMKGTEASSGKKPSRNASKEKKVIDNPSKPPYIDQEKLLSQLSEQEKSIVSQLRQGPRGTDDVVHNAGLPMAKAMPVLTMLEIKGVIRRLPGNLIALREQ